MIYQFKLWCITEEKWITTGFHETVPIKCPNDDSHSINQITKERRVDPQKNQVPIHFAFDQPNRPYLEISSTCWKIVTIFWYEGLNISGFPYRMKLLVGGTPDATGTLGIFIHNTRTELARINWTNEGLDKPIETTKFTNVPMNGTSLEIRIRKEKGSGFVVLSYFSLYLSE